MKSQNSACSALGAVLVTAILLAAGLSGARAQEQSIHERMFHSRAIEAVVWAMPLLNFKSFRDGHASVGVGYNDIAYHSKIQDWKFQTATPNNTTPYVNFYWTIKDGPVVVEMPPSADGVGIFGTLMDAWQRPIDDVGAAGRDRGRGARYILAPPSYDGPVLPGAFVYKQRTNHGFAVLRAIIPDASPETLAKAVDFAKKIKVYPLADAAKPPQNKYVDIYGKLNEMTPVLDGGVFANMHEILQEEVVEEHNKAIMGLLARIGIKKGAPFKPDAKTQAVYDKAAPEALQYMMEQYHRFLNPLKYENKKWSVLVPPGAIETDFSYEFPNYFDYHARGALYYAVITSVKNYGTATFYLDLAETADGKWLDGSGNYKLVVPPKVPARDFWAVTAYDLLTASYIREVSKGSVDSNQADLKKNSDGSVDVYFGPEAPVGKEANWIPTQPDRRFFLLFRFYGPEKGIFDGSFELNDIEKIQ
jgi:hypothetical protein